MSVILWSLDCTSQMVLPKLWKLCSQLKVRLRFSSYFVVPCSTTRPCASVPGVYFPSTRMFACMFGLRQLERTERVRLSHLVNSAPQLLCCLRWRRNVFREKLKLKALMFDKHGINLAPLLSGQWDKEKYSIHLRGHPKPPLT